MLKIVLFFFIRLKIYLNCETKISPINIETPFSKNPNLVIKSNFTDIDYYEILKNEKKFFEIKPNLSLGSIFKNKKEYFFSNFFLKYPSEHLIENKRYPFEIQILFKTKTKKTLIKNFAKVKIIKKNENLKNGEIIKENVNLMNEEIENKNLNNEEILKEDENLINQEITKENENLDNSEIINNNEIIQIDLNKEIAGKKEKIDEKQNIKIDDKENLENTDIITKNKIVEIQGKEIVENLKKDNSENNQIEKQRILKNKDNITNKKNNENITNTEKKINSDNSINFKNSKITNNINNLINDKKIEIEENIVFSFLVIFTKEESDKLIFEEWGLEEYLRRNKKIKESSKIKIKGNFNLSNFFENGKFDFFNYQGDTTFLNCEKANWFINSIPFFLSSKIKNVFDLNNESYFKLHNNAKIDVKRINIDFLSHKNNKKKILEKDSNLKKKKKKKKDSNIKKDKNSTSKKKKKKTDLKKKKKSDLKKQEDVLKKKEVKIIPNNINNIIIEKTEEELKILKKLKKNKFKIDKTIEENLLKKLNKKKLEDFKCPLFLNYFEEVKNLGDFPKNCILPWKKKKLKNNFDFLIEKLNLTEENKYIFCFLRNYFCEKKKNLIPLIFETPKKFYLDNKIIFHKNIPIITKQKQIKFFMFKKKKNNFSKKQKKTLKIKKKIIKEYPLIKNIKLNSFYPNFILTKGIIPKDCILSTIPLDEKTKIINLKIPEIFKNKTNSKLSVFCYAPFLGHYLPIFFLIEKNFFFEIDQIYENFPIYDFEKNNFFDFKFYRGILKSEKIFDFDFFDFQDKNINDYLLEIFDFEKKIFLFNSEKNENLSKFKKDIFSIQIQNSFIKNLQIKKFVDNLLNAIKKNYDLKIDIKKDKKNKMNNYQLLYENENFYIPNLFPNYNFGIFIKYHFIEIKEFYFKKKMKNKNCKKICVKSEIKLFVNDHTTEDKCKKWKCKKIIKKIKKKKKNKKKICQEIYNGKLSYENLKNNVDKKELNNFCQKLKEDFDFSLNVLFNNIQNSI